MSSSQNTVVDIRRVRSHYKTNELTAPQPFANLSKSAEGWFLRHDALGQMPIHYMNRGNTVFVANSIKDLRLMPGYSYETTRVLRNGHALRISPTGEATQVSEIDFSNYRPTGFEVGKLGDVEYSALYIRRRFDEIADQLFAVDRPVAALLSGGVDSMLAAYLLSRRRPGAPTYNLGLSADVEDVHLASSYAKAFGLDYRYTPMTPEMIVDSFAESIWRSEIYHLYNVYCAVGMVLLARRLATDGIDVAISGEGANEAFGDYHDWTIRTRDGGSKTIQTTDIAAFNSVRGRHAYVWGNPVSEKQGYFNQQLGSGLAKHGVARMYKPMYDYGVQLLSPFMNLDVLKVLASIHEDDVARIGGKTGFMRLAFDPDCKAGTIPSDFLVNRKKTRLQDANPHGQGGITEILLGAGLDQEKTLSIFNQQFSSHVTLDARFSKTELR